MRVRLRSGQTGRNRRRPPARPAASRRLERLGLLHDRCRVRPRHAIHRNRHAPRSRLVFSRRDTRRYLGRRLLDSGAVLVRAHLVDLVRGDGSLVHVTARKWRDVQLRGLSARRSVRFRSHNTGKERTWTLPTGRAQSLRRGSGEHLPTGARAVNCCHWKWKWRQVLQPGSWSTVAVGLLMLSRCRPGAKSGRCARRCSGIC